MDAKDATVLKKSVEGKTVPIVDITPFTTTGYSPEVKKHVATELASKASIDGCVGISGHGVPDEVVATAFVMTKKLFELPFEEKMKAPHPDAPVPHRGYSGTGRENAARKTETEDWDGSAKKADYEKLTDYKESYEIGSESNEVNYNIWLPEQAFPGFRTWGLELYWRLHETAMSILEALMMSLELAEDEMEEVRALHTGHDHQLRLLHYPPIEEVLRKDKHTSRLGAHTDWSQFTLLFQDEHGGLQFLNRSTGEFIDAVPMEGVLYMNIGDMFQRISNGFYPSALHRVIIKNPHASRYSIPFFVPPNSDGIIRPQPSRVEKDGEEKYEVVTFREYSRKAFESMNVYN
ncbi:putative leucoanthocyanidin dioxygenase [Periconia macrospinosa]|uniref:Putative leucoanthocyanidin dioxygenase n=1 Tax=Periconia macrospinosa TaxID=97972 RepID=A0A2V1ECJ9_9PLEO|nr:putative leucoanthocyanidin dioxygenase [Periconia macrospinosa]